jgi:uncharacterized protein (TIGR03435 family)
MSLYRLTVLAALFSVLATAQTLTPPKLAFEVSDVKVSSPGGTPNVDFLPGGKIVANFVTMKELLAVAWSKREEYVIGGPSWLGEEHYDIVAKATPAAKEADLALMLQSLLFERFKLALHMEKKPMPVYVLTAGKKGPKLTESTAPASEEASCKMQLPTERKDGQILRSLICKNAPISALVERLPNVAPAYVDHPVVDQTELKGRYDFTLEWAPRRGGRGAVIVGGGAAGEVPAPDPDGATIFGAVQSQLGLKLEPRKLPMDVLVIDKLERVPTEN